ncbi:MAG: helix-turn-helix domain-containing protein [Sporocytophaga sp.]|uniref:helix-turn-helix domain-containing protein n=1 Tax=Sporocytophaga sp. TaxID=2231183 RepID=UPI001AFEFEBC|nr:helix-turn-helix domain-containing protein [Sporocytophaga sp.]MBO9699263.1 helix-turn-helix domain-containing protein [Sporocytophaga sp.]
MPVKSGETIIMTMDELRQFGEDLITSTLKKLNVKPVQEEYLTSEEVKKELGVCNTTFYKLLQSPINPLPMEGTPKKRRITKEAFAKWRQTWGKYNYA